MLTLTPNATVILNDLLHQPGATAASAVRITDELPEPGLALVPVEQPGPEDQIVNDGGALVYLDPTAAAVLDDKILDASVTADGKVEFSLSSR